MLEKANVDLNLPDKMIRPENFKDIENKELVYEGLLNKYKKKSLLKDYIEVLTYKTANQNK